MAPKRVGGQSEEKQATPELQKICDEVRNRFTFCFDALRHVIVLINYIIIYLEITVLYALKHND